MKKYIAVVAGGYSHEAEVSMKSAGTVMKNLDSDRFKPYLVTMDRSGWFCRINEENLPIDKNDFSVLTKHGKIKFDRVFIAIHGTPGEDGKLQAYFDLLDIPYSTSGHLATTLTFNKYLCNAFLRQHGIACAHSVLLRAGETYDAGTILESIQLPCFVKPNDGGSSFGISKVKTAKDFVPAVELALQHGTEAIVESFMDGTEVTCGMVQFNETFHLLPLTEIESHNEFFDYKAKYEGRSREITPARISSELTQKVHATAQSAFRLLGLKGMARIDFIIQNETPYLIEVNTVPGLSPESIFPQMAKAYGMPLTDIFSGLLAG